jgi:hypothetical protein
LTRDDLERWWTRGDAADRDRIFAHLAECDACIVRYGALMDARPAETPPLTPVADAVPLGLRVPDAQPADAWRRSGRAWQFAALGAAAALVLAIVFLPARDSQPPVPDSAVRATRLTLIAPIGTVAIPAELRWVSPIAASHYRVEIHDAAERELYAATIEGERLSLPDDLQRLLQPGQEYRWRVTALDPEGQPMMRSEAGAFVVAGR